MTEEQPRKIIRVGTRKSPLAMIQTNKVVEQMKKFHPNTDFEIVAMSTKGDKILDTALSKIGEKSLFTKELENALYDNKVDFVVHSLKDLPTTLPEGLCIGAVCKRDSPHDAVVMHPKYKDETLQTLPAHCAIGTSSLRRAAQLKSRYPSLQFQDIRGNLNTRLKKLDDADDYAAIILAVAGLDRMGWADRISQELDSSECMYAVSQGAMAVECRESDRDIVDHLKQLNHHETSIRCVAERSFLRTLEGGCSVPVAVHTEIKDNKLYMKGGVFSVDGTESRVDSVEGSLDGEDGPEAKKMRSDENMFPQYASIVATKDTNTTPMKKAEQLGNELAQKILKAGGDVILEEAKRYAVSEIDKLKQQKAAQAAAKRQELQGDAANGLHGNGDAVSSASAR